MNVDTIWQILRYGMIALGSWFAARGYVTGEQWELIIAGLGTMFPVIWGLFVKSGTKAVPQAVADRPSVPTVSAATGKIETPTKGK